MSDLIISILTSMRDVMMMMLPYVMIGSFFLLVGSLLTVYLIGKGVIGIIRFLARSNPNAITHAVNNIVHVINNIELYLNPNTFQILMALIRYAFYSRSGNQEQMYEQSEQESTSEENQQSGQESASNTESNNDISNDISNETSNEDQQSKPKSDEDPIPQQPQQSEPQQHKTQPKEEQEEPEHQHQQHNEHQHEHNEHQHEFHSFGSTTRLLMLANAQLPSDETE